MGGGWLYERNERRRLDEEAKVQHLDHVVCNLQATDRIRQLVISAALGMEGIGKIKVEFGAYGFAVELGVRGTPLESRCRRGSTHR